MGSKSPPLRVANWLLTILTVTPFLLADTPEPPPYHQYSVSGTLQRPGGGSTKDFAVTLLGWFPDQNQSVFLPFEGVAYPLYSDHTIALTDSSGAFFVRVSSNFRADSVRLAVVIPENPAMPGNPWYIDGSVGIPTIIYYEVPGEPGCFGIEGDPVTESKTSFYSYLFFDQTISISY